ncbi:hypothetical protein PGIGA_G00119130 [Pangasianodon gigas]|uniref:Uncharacterized protein n=1 Tax=Pangasianodon gigas TaxID=30993 RepID=A0ACC5XGA0_PANGG|nr:hypothetical protein [Pangasianodon gigas]
MKLERFQETPTETADLYLGLISITSLMTVQGQSDGGSVVMAMYNISASQGSQAVLQCHSQRMVWTQDRLKDRQRVVHWDLLRSTPNYAVERVLDMFSAGDQRIYNAYNQGRISMPKTAFKDGNFSLIIKNVAVSDRGIYSCNLHHHYCHLFESIKVQLNITKSARKERRFWDGQKAVYVVLVGSTVVLPCVNRRSIWMEGNNEEEQQVVHWDRQAPGVQHDRADRLIDLYASGERRHYGPLFIQQKMNISASAFSYGNFSLIISDLQPADQGLYSCHLHHHYCGLHERRIFQLTVGPPVLQKPTDAPHVLPNENHITKAVDTRPHVINFILPEHQSHFLQELGYILATLLLLALIILAIVLLTHRWKARAMEYYPCAAKKVDPPFVTYTGCVAHTSKDYDSEIQEVKTCNQEEKKLEFKNNLLKEAEMSKLCSSKVTDLDREM